MYKFYKNVHLYIHFWFHIQELIDVGDTHNFHHVHSTNQTNFEERMCACFMKYVGKYFKNYWVSKATDINVHYEKKSTKLV